MVPLVEKAMVDDGIILIKYLLNVSVDEQTRRLESRIDDPRKIWKLSPTDLKSYSRQYAYCRARDAMIVATDTGWAPWYIVDNDDKKRGRLNIITHLLSQIPYEPLRAAGREDAQAAERTRVRRTGVAAAQHPDTLLTQPTRSTAVNAEERTRAMTEKPSTRARTMAAATAWYALTPEDVAKRLDVDPAQGLSAAKAAELLQKNGPNALPAEATVPGWKQFLAQYRSYMQIILVGAAIASILIGEVSTGIAVLAITALNALGGMRQQGKAESAMNALQSMLKTSARVRRDGTEVKIDADQVVVGDVVLLAAGDDVCADGRIIEATSLQIDESALTGESVPASKSAEVITDEKPGPGGPVEHGVHEHPGHARQRRDDRHRDGRRHRGGHASPGC